MIAERIEEAGNLGAGDVEEGGEQDGEAEQTEDRFFGFEADPVGARELFDGLVAKFGGVAGDGHGGEFAGQRSEGGILGLRAELEDIDEARAEPRMAGFEDAGDVLEGIAFFPAEPEAPRGAGDGQE